VLGISSKWWKMYVRLATRLPNERSRIALLGSAQIRFDAVSTVRKDSGFGNHVGQLARIWVKGSWRRYKLTSRRLFIKDLTLVALGQLGPVHLARRRLLVAGCIGANLVFALVVLPTLLGGDVEDDELASF
jgi:hypothetical protein